jgi:hypothetical protein
MRELKIRKGKRRVVVREEKAGDTRPAEMLRGAFNQTKLHRRAL